MWRTRFTTLALVTPLDTSYLNWDLASGFASATPLTSREIRLVRVCGRGPPPRSPIVPKATEIGVTSQGRLTRYGICGTILLTTIRCGIGHQQRISIALSIYWRG